MPSKAEQREKSHASILESAANLLRAKGISGAKVAEIMKGANLTVGGFYAHFASKEALVDEVLRRAARATRDRLFVRLGEKPAGDRAAVVIKRYLSAAHRDDTARGCPLPAVASEIGTTAPEHSVAVSDQVDSLAGELEAHLPQSESIAPRHLALGLTALLVGGLSLSRAVRATALSDEILRASRALALHVVARLQQGTS